METIKTFFDKLRIREDFIGELERQYSCECVSHVVPLKRLLLFRSLLVPSRVAVLHREAYGSFFGVIVPKGRVRSQQVPSTKTMFGLLIVTGERNL